MTNMVHGEHKKRRHVFFTDTAWEHLADIAHDARLSNSETLDAEGVQPLLGQRHIYNSQRMWTTKEAVDSSIFQMKASDLLVRLRAYLAEHEDCDVKLYSEQCAFEEAFDFHSEVITDVRVVNDCPLQEKA